MFHYKFYFHTSSNIKCINWFHLVQTDDNVLYKVDVYTLFHLAEVQFNVTADICCADFIDPNYGEGNAL